MKDCQVVRNERATKLQSLLGCALCILDKRPCGIQDGNVTSQKLHNRMFHGCKSSYCNAVRTMMNINQEGEEEDEPVMLLLMVKIVFPNLKPTIMFMDDGSMGSIITHKLAVFLGLKRKPVTQWIEVARKKMLAHLTAGGPLLCPC